jgi:hypothetical protein
MYDKITDRVKKLIALALGTHSQEEARTAAKMAVDHAEKAIQATIK